MAHFISALNMHMCRLVTVGNSEAKSGTSPGPMAAEVHKNQGGWHQFNIAAIAAGNIMLAEAAARQQPVSIDDLVQHYEKLPEYQSMLPLDTSALMARWREAQK